MKWEIVKNINIMYIYFDTVQPLFISFIIVMNDIFNLPIVTYKQVYSIYPYEVETAGANFLPTQIRLWLNCFGNCFRFDGASQHICRSKHSET